MAGVSKVTQTKQSAISRRKRRARKQPQAAAPAIAPSAIDEGKKLLDTNAAAAYLSLTPMTMRHRRWRGEGPRFYRYGGPLARCFYRVSDLEEYLAEHLRTSNAQTLTPEVAAVAARARGR